MTTTVLSPGYADLSDHSYICTLLSLNPEPPSSHPVFSERVTPGHRTLHFGGTKYDLVRNPDNSWEWLIFHQGTRVLTGVRWGSAASVEKYFGSLEPSRLPLSDYSD